MERNQISRRKFIGVASAIGGLSMLPSLFRNGITAAVKRSVPNMAVINSKNYYNAAVEAVNLLGGMKQFVADGSTVGLLINGKFKNPGTYTNPDIALATVKMCYEAGASEVIIFFGGDGTGYWNRSEYYDSHKEYLDKLQYATEHKKVNINNGVIIKEAELASDFFRLDTFINLPIAKHHRASMLTNCLKNMMGLNTGASNRYFHSASPGKGKTDNNRLSQCIADLNTVRKTDLCLVDATEFILNNGPFGPGEVQTENKIIAGTDPVAIDTYCANLHGMDITEVPSLDFAEKHKIGTTDLSSLIIKEVELT
ncbi:MAG: DUF362 domain-containing protein [Bacteroidales bacterium]|nr:DUF362 domain-containing protein [Bacteroidales bacterium]